jgi:transposase-like protein
LDEEVGQVSHSTSKSKPKSQKQYSDSERFYYCQQILNWLEKGATLSEATRHFKISQSSFYKWRPQFNFQQPDFLPVEVLNSSPTSKQTIEEALTCQLDSVSVSGLDIQQLAALVYSLSQHKALRSS